MPENESQTRKKQLLTKRRALDRPKGGYHSHSSALSSDTEPSSTGITLTAKEHTRKEVSGTELQMHEMDGMRRETGQRVPRAPVRKESLTRERSDVFRQNLHQSQASIPPNAEAHAGAFFAALNKPRPARKHHSATLASLGSEYTRLEEEGSHATCDFLGPAPSSPESAPVTDGIQAPAPWNRLGTSP